MLSVAAHAVGSFSASVECSAGITAPNHIALQAAPIQYMVIEHHEKFHVGVFLMQKGAVFPLHDHPSMTVVRFVGNADLFHDEFQFI